MRSVVSFVCFAAAVTGQANWLAQSPPAGPGAREGHSLVHDPATQRTFAMWGTAAVPTFSCAMSDGAELMV